MRTMRAKILGPLLLASVICGGTLSQDSQKGDSVRVRLYETSGAGSDELMEATTDAALYFGHLPDKVMVRLCSRETMPIAVTTSATDPLAFAERMHRNFGLP